MRSRVVGGVLVLLLAAPVEAQRPGHVVGVVRDTSGQPLPDVQVQLAWSRIVTRTDSAGRFALRGIPVGVRVIQARRIGFAPVDTTVRILPDSTSDVRIVMARGAVLLDTVNVAASCPSASILGFYCRQRHLGGTFLEGDSIAALDAGYDGTGDIFRERKGWRMGVNKAGWRYPIANAGWKCLTELVNGRPPGFSLPPRSLKDVFAVEIYTEPREVPAQYQQWTWKGPYRCSLVIYWTKRRSTR